jgi:hypothetical protein
VQAARWSRVHGTVPSLVTRLVQGAGTGIDRTQRYECDMKLRRVASLDCPNVRKVNLGNRTAT